MIKIEKGFTFTGRKNRQSKYPFKEMKVGDSFFVPSTEGNTYNKLFMSAYSWAKTHAQSWKFGVQKEEKDTIKGFRVFRLK